MATMTITLSVNFNTMPHLKSHFEFMSCDRRLSNVWWFYVVFDTNSILSTPTSHWFQLIQGHTSAARDSRSRLSGRVSHWIFNLYWRTFRSQSLLKKRFCDRTILVHLYLKTVFLFLTYVHHFRHVQEKY